MRIHKLLPLISLICFLFQCNADRVYESNVDFEDRIWLAEATQRFIFTVPDSISSYNVYCNIRNTLDYPNYNLYLKYWMYDSLGLPLKSDLINIELFNPKSGFPNGKSGLGDIFSHQVPILQEYNFKYSGNYTVVLQHFMRNDTLREVISVGVKLERAISPQGPQRD